MSHQTFPKSLTAANNKTVNKVNRDITILKIIKFTCVK